MRLAAVTALLFAATFGSARADNIETAANVLVCADPLSVKDAYKAASGRDPAWLKELGCVYVAGGIPGVLLDGDYIDGTWRVRLRPPGRDGTTVYGWSCSFRLPGKTEAFGCGRSSIY